MQRDLGDLAAGFFESGERSHERMTTADFTVPIGANDQQVATRRVGKRSIKELQRSLIGPLQIVQEQHQRVRSRGKDPHEILKDQVETVLLFGGTQRRDVRLRADDELQLGNQIEEQLAT